MNRTSHAWILVLGALILAACGGGGGGEGPSPAPTASFTVEPSRGEVALTVSFDARASSAAEGTLTDHAWDFGDGDQGSGVQVQHTYREPGTFQPRLTVTDSGGRSASTTRTVTVDPPPPTFSVSGELVIGSASAVDSDTNDPNAPFRSNDSMGSAQSLRLPVTVGGYLARPGAGPAGAVRDGGDISDFYRFQAEGGERVELIIGNPELNGDGIARNDLDLVLRDTDGAILEESRDDGPTETLEIKNPGEYVLEVWAYSGATTYVMSIGTGEIASTPSNLRLKADFVPGEMLLGPERLGPAAADAPTVPYQLVAGRSHPAMRLARLPRSPGLARRTDSAARPHTAHAASPVPDAALRDATLEAIKAMRRSGRYAWVEPNPVRTQQADAPDDPLLERQWHYRNIQLPLAWERTRGDPDVHVAVIDSGVLLEHPDLEAKLLPGWDFVDDVPGAADPGDNLGGGSASYHGTHVTGIIAADTDNARGVAGAGWHTRVLPIRVLGRSGGTSSDLIQALRFAAGKDNRSEEKPDRPVDIINLSLGGSSPSAQEEALLEDLREAGIFVVAAAGNRGSDAPFYPAAYDSVIGVSATDISNQVASYSNFGAFIDLAAPGGESVTDSYVLSTVGRDIVDPDTREVVDIEYVYQGRAGTSMAAPHVAAVIALMKAIHPALTPKLFDDMLEAGLLTDDLGEPGRDPYYGHGLINARKAVIAAEMAANDALVLPARLTVSPSRLDFGAFTTGLRLTLSNAGTEPLTVDETKVDVPWLEVAPESVTAEGLGSYNVTVDRERLDDGRYDGEIRFVSDASTVAVPVRMRVAAPESDSDAGFHYIILADPHSGEVMHQVTAEAVDGRYSFEFVDVPQGEYELYAGTDMSNNFLVCDAAEACALYPTLDAPGILEVDRDIDGLEFITGFRATRFDATDAASNGQRSHGAAARPRLEVRP